MYDWCYNTVRNCTFARLNIAGPSERNQILNNSFSDSTYDGITISNENHTLLKNNDISECNAAMVLSSVSYLNVFNNRINSCASVGIAAYDINSSSVLYNNFSNMIPRGTAISFSGSYDSIISNNYLFDNRRWQISISQGNNVSLIENLILNKIQFDYGDTMISLT
jgi:parallel beta-helix repeat protein